MFKKNNDLESGWNDFDPKSSKKKNKKSDSSIKKSWVGKKLTKDFSKKFNFLEKIVKFIILAALVIFVSSKRLSQKSKKNELVKRTYEKISSSEFSFIPPSTAFFILLSFIPIISLVLILLSTISDYQKVFVDEILKKFIPGLSDFISSFQKNKELSSLENTGIWFLVASLIWISSSGYARFVYSISYIYGHKNLGNVISNKIKGIFIVIAMALYITLALLIYIPFINFLKKNLDDDSLYLTFFYISATIYVVFFYYFGMILFFKFVPKFRLKWKHINPGVWISVLPISLFTVSFGFLASLSSYGSYGILGTFIYISFFTLILTYFMYVGVMANEAYYKTYFSLDTYGWFERK
ncbi:unknown; predicted coding region [Mycoplasmopsis pulmonis]|uniref:Uncharacterized protein n=1 Tax=Mycoplasmopsis pulmonis (strain UAB CTIP) TaxID=272635 RepID=Q98R08_MYCPU|nr:YihY/virulence factor BrkB family protein [Mycoplasmopsis pulmonis]MDZ7293168.1 YihY/virulence factor BrkB family protein [Mycoplasmopsis pulmonis]CAC13375.1 unknown; predicted coding region [Mycoplasmopsis pulmonis]VEU67965.1 Uncharacterised protein [Mycoplasmopsis pulmonis]